MNLRLDVPSPVRRAATVAGLAAASLIIASCSSGDDTTRDESGAIVEEGQIDAFSINVGDCLIGSTVGEVSGFEGVPCAEAHDVEVYHTFDLADGAFPGSAGMEEEAGQGCFDAFETYVGLDYASSIYDFSWLEPTADSWAAGDREIACLMNNFDGTQKTGSAAGTQV